MKRCYNFISADFAWAVCFVHTILSHILLISSHYWDTQILTCSFARCCLMMSGIHIVVLFSRLCVTMSIPWRKARALRWRAQSSASSDLALILASSFLLLQQCCSELVKDDDILSFRATRSHAIWKDSTSNTHGLKSLSAVSSLWSTKALEHMPVIQQTSLFRHWSLEYSCLPFHGFDLAGLSQAAVSSGVGQLMLISTFSSAASSLSLGSSMRSFCSASSDISWSSVPVGESDWSVTSYKECYISEHLPSSVDVLLSHSSSL